jgi:predicted RNase H-like nuclease (RuvC/YqgF family)
MYRIDYFLTSDARCETENNELKSKIRELEQYNTELESRVTMLEQSSLIAGHS